MNQAIHGFRQRHPEATIAVAELDLAEALRVSQASVQKWRAGHPIAPHHISGLARWAITRAGMSPSWLEAFLRACEYDAPDRAALLRSATSPTDLSQACRDANFRLWGHDRLEAVALHHFPRPALLALLEDFLASDRPGLILVAPSGMGKTDFALWLACQETFRDYPVLACPAGTLDGERPLHDHLTSLLFRSAHSLGEAVLTWPLLVILDGVNESPDMLRLTWQADRALLQAEGIKILLTFRPESFQILRSGLTLSAHRYYIAPLPSGTEGLLRDPPVYRLLPLTPAELPRVYESYRRAYDLQTPFSALSPTLRAYLRHPFTLHLVAEAWSGRPLPETVGEERLIQDFLDGVYRRGRISHTDIRFLEEQIVPRMVSPGRWRNALPVAEVLAGASAPPPHHPFTRLADVGLLSSTNGRLDEPIRFAHERFYEHFARRHFRRLRDGAPDPVAFYSALGDVPWFLHGPLRRLVTEEIAQLLPPKERDLWATLASLPEPVLAGALEDHCRAHPAGTAFFLRTLWRLSRSFYRSPAPWQMNLQSVVLTAASALGRGALLGEFLPHAYPSARSAGIVYAKDLWATHPEAAQTLLTGLADRLLRPLGLPDPTVISVFGQVVLLSLFDYGERPEVLSFLGTLLRDLVRRTIHGLRGRLVLHLAARWLIEWLRQAAVASDLSGDLDRDFRLSPEERACLRALAPYVDWETPGFSSPEARRLVVQALGMGSLPASWIAILAIVQQGMGNPREGWTAIRCLLAEADVPSPPLWADGLFYGVHELIRHAPTTDPAIWGPLGRGAAFVLASYPDWHKALQARWRGRPPSHPGPAMGLAPYVLARDSARLPVETGPVWEVVREKLEEADRTFALDYLRQMRFVALDGRRPRLALRLLEPLATHPDPVVQDTLADLLALLQGTVSEDVRDYLERVAPPEMAARVAGRHPEIPTHTWLYYRLEEWIFPFLVRSRASRRLVADLTALVADAHSAREWVQRSFALLLKALEGSLP